MKLARRLLWILVALVAAYALLGFVILPPILRSQLAKGLSSTLHRPAAIGKVALNPFALSCTVKDLLIREKIGEKTFLSLGELYLNIESSSLWKRGLVVREVRLSKPYAAVARTEAGRYNFSDLVESQSSPKDKKTSKPFRFAVGNIQIVQGSADFLDTPRGKNHTLRDLNTTIPFVSNFPAFLETFVQPKLRMTVDGQSLSAEGESKPFANSLETSATMELKDFEIPQYIEYLPFKIAARMPSASFDLSTRISYVQYRDRGPSLTLGGNLALRDVVLNTEQGAPLLRLPSATAAFGPVEVFSRSARAAKLRIEGAEIQASRNAKGRWNWAALLPESAAAPPKETADAPKEDKRSTPFSYQIDEVGLEKIEIGFEDLSRAKPFRTVVSPLDLSVRNLTNAAGGTGDFALTLATEAAESLEVKGSLGLTPVKTAGAFKLAGLRLAKYAPFYDKQIRFDLKGSLDLGSQYTYEAKTGGPAAQLKELSLLLSSLEARRQEEAEPFLRAPRFQVRDTELDLAGKKVFLGKISGDKGSLNLLRAAGNTWNVAQLTPSPAAATPPVKPARGARTGQPPKDKGTPWTVTVGNLNLRDFGVRVTDNKPADVTRLSFSHISVDASNLSTVPRSQGKLTAKASLNKRGTLAAKGTVSLAPVAANLVLALESAEIAPFQPYFTDKIQVLVTDGAISANGTLTVGGSSTAAKATPITYTGGFLVSGLAVNDKHGVDEIARFGSLALSGIDLRSDPVSVKIEGVSLSDFSGAIAIEQDGRVNLLDLVKAEPSPVPPPGKLEAAPEPAGSIPEKATSPRIDVKTLTLQGGRVRFTDRHIKPTYTSTLDELGGRVSGLTSQEGLLADVDLRARLNGYAPMEITGRVNPLQRDPYVDLKAEVKGMDLSVTTPYAGKYLGYTIQQGKLFLDVRYHIEKRKLDSQNVVIFDRLTLGDKVESADATKIPVRFGLALLTDRNGQVHIDVPIDGNLDDPKFHIGKFVWNVIVNLLAKAITSPFSALGSLFGGGEELGFVDFAPGETVIDVSGLKKVEKLAKALHERPALRLEVLGRTDPEKDANALKELLYARKLKAQKAKEILKGGESVAAVDAVTISQEELPKYLTLAYKAEKFPKPKTALGFEKDLPPAEMEKLIRSHLQVGADDLRLVAAQRADAVRDAFAKTGLVEASRVFLIEGDNQTKEQASQAPAPRVDFVLK